MTNYSNLSIPILVTIYFFLIGFIFFCKRQSAAGSSRGSVRGGRTSRRGNWGLDSAMIETFPTFQYSVVKGLKLGKGALECAVCLNEFEDDDTIRLLPKCDHVFHAECVDAWLFKQTTCPVCRANLAPESGETNATTAGSVQGLEGESEGEIWASEIVDEENQQVSIHVISEEEPPREVAVAVAAAVAPEVIDPVQNQMQNGPSGKLPRSHSTGHSVVQMGEDIERFTLRLPDDVRKQIMKKRLNRTNSMGLLPRVRSSRRGYRTSGEGSSRGGREGWVFSMMPSFMRRASPASSPKIRGQGDSAATTPTTPTTPPPAKPFRSPLRVAGV